MVAVLACSLFAGAAVYINLVEHPARLACGTEIACTCFGICKRFQRSLAQLSTRGRQSLRSFSRVSRAIRGGGLVSPHGRELPAIR
jgi:hypothetical protein